MVSLLLQATPDTTVVMVARDNLGSISAWAGLLLIVTMVLLLAVLTLLLYELRGLSKQLRGVADTFGDRSRPLIESATGVAKNVEYVSDVIRGDVEKVRDSVDGLSSAIANTSQDIQTRLADLSALMDLAQTEAEEAVLDTAARVRTLRAGTKLLRSKKRKKPSAGASNDGAPSTAPTPGRSHNDKASGDE